MSAAENRQAVPKGQDTAAKLLRFLLPLLVALVGTAIWEAVVRLDQIPLYVLPGPVAVIGTLISDWSEIGRAHV